MKQEKLEYLFDYLPKSKLKAGDGLKKGEYPFYTSSEIQSKYSDNFQHDPGCLVFGTGGKASVHLATSRFSTSTDCITIKPKSEVSVDVAYVYQYFKSNMQVLENGFKGAGLKHISKEYLSNIEIPCPNEIDDQRRISNLLGKVEALIVQRKQHLKQLDDFLKSVFFDMFGPTSMGYADWPMVDIKSLAAQHKGAMRTGPFGSNLLHSEFTDDGDVAVLGIDNAVQNRFVWGERRFITNDKYRELINYKIFPGDVIVTIMGTIGRSAVVPSDIPLAINTKHLAAITVNTELVEPLFLSYSIHSSPFILNQFKNKNRGAIMSGLNLGLIKETKLKCPPIERQRKFAAIHIRIDELKIRYHSSMAELEAIYGALSQQAFKGELDLSRVSLPPDNKEGSQKAEQKCDRSTVPETFKLPEPPEGCEWLSAENRQALIEFWLGAWFQNYVDEPFSSTEFIDSAYHRLVELSERDSFRWDDPDHGWDEAPWYAEPSPFGINEYEYIKKWIFDCLNQGQLSQKFDNKNNSIQMTKAKSLY